MPTRRGARLACAVLAFGLAACGGDGNGGGSARALGEEAVVEHTQLAGGGSRPATTLGITVLAVRKGTQEELQQAGFELDPAEKRTTPYYVDTRWENQGDQGIERSLQVSVEDPDGNLFSPTPIVALGDQPFEKCKDASDGELEPGDSYETCLLFLVSEGKQPSKVSFLPNNPGSETEFVYWDIE